MNSPSALPVLLDPYAGRTILNPIMAFLIVILCFAILRAPRKYAIVSFIIAMNCIPGGQRIFLFGMNFTAMRILTIVALVRILLRRDGSPLRVTPLDGVVAFYAIVAVVTHVLQIGTSHALLAALGSSLDKFWPYVVARLLIRDLDDVRTIVTAFALSSVLIFILFLDESRTGIDAFHRFGGVPDHLQIRGTRVRAQGPYGDPITAGALFASILPLVVAYRFRNGHRRFLMYLSMFCIPVIIRLTVSSTPLASLAVAIMACVLYYQRNLLTITAITGAIAAVLMMLFWWHPIWFLFTKINFTGHSGNYFRYFLLNEFIIHWRSWFLIGVRNTFEWGRHLGLGGVGLVDLTNGYVIEGVHHGILGLGSYLTAIGLALRYTGKLVAAARTDDDRRAYWHLGAAVFVTATSFLGVDYFGQELFAWWMMLAMCSSLYSRFIETERAAQANFGSSAV